MKIAELVFGDELPTGISVCMQNEWTELTREALTITDEILQKTLTIKDMTAYGIEADDLLPELCELFYRGQSNKLRLYTNRCDKTPTAD